jgi:hypothetical protein
LFPSDGFLNEVPRGLQSLGESHRSRFDVRGVIQLYHVGWVSAPAIETPQGTRWQDVPGVPRSVEGILVGQKCSRLHFLHATRGQESDDTVIGGYILQFADGKREEIPIVYGDDLREWIVKNDSNDLRVAKMAWIGTNAKQGAIRLFCRTWENPHPEIEIQCLDFVSKMTKCAPFLVAITAEP